MVDVMLSVHCGTMLAHANNLKTYLLAQGYTVFLCDQMNIGDNYRTEISINASNCKAIIPFMNKPWCNSKECEFEFNIAVRTNFTNNGSPAIVPLLLEQFPEYKAYPTINGILCSTNGLPVTEDDLNDSTWEKLVKALHEKGIGKDIDPSLIKKPPPQVVEHTEPLHKGAFVLEPGESKAKIATNMMSNTVVHVQNSTGKLGKIQIQAGVSAAEDNDVAPHHTSNFSRYFGGFKLYLANSGDVPLTCWTV